MPKLRKSKVHRGSIHMSPAAAIEFNYLIDVLVAKCGQTKGKRSVKRLAKKAGMSEERLLAWMGELHVNGTKLQRFLDVVNHELDEEWTIERVLIEIGLDELELG